MGVAASVQNKYGTLPGATGGATEGATGASLQRRNGVCLEAATGSAPDTEVDAAGTFGQTGEANLSEPEVEGRSTSKQSTTSGGSCASRRSSHPSATTLLQSRHFALPDATEAKLRRGFGFRLGDADEAETFKASDGAKLTVPEANTRSTSKQSTASGRSGSSNRRRPSLTYGNGMHLKQHIYEKRLEEQERMQATCA